VKTESARQALLRRADSDRRGSVYRFNHVIRNTTMNEFGLVSVAELAKQLCCSKRSIATWVAQGRLPKPLMIGGHRFWRHEDVKHLTPRCLHYHTR
jgi:excisionase family DNA binding protein